MVSTKQTKGVFRDSLTMSTAVKRYEVVEELHSLIIKLGGAPTFTLPSVMKVISFKDSTVSFTDESSVSSTHVKSAQGPAHCDDIIVKRDDVTSPSMNVLEKRINMKGIFDLPLISAAYCGLLFQTVILI